MRSTEYSIHVHMSHIEGVLNNIPDELSRGGREPSSACYRFREMYYQRYSGDATVDAYCDERGKWRQPGCYEHVSAERPVTAHKDELVGKRVWMNPPWTQAEEAVKLAFWAWRQDPVNTKITLLVPDKVAQA